MLLDAQGDELEAGLWEAQHSSAAFPIKETAFATSEAMPASVQSSNIAYLTKSPFSTLSAPELPPAACRTASTCQVSTFRCFTVCLGPNQFSAHCQLLHYLVSPTRLRDISFTMLFLFRSPYSIFCHFVRGDNPMWAINTCSDG
jgi:hypothetical protein